jgi:uncharacterized membrane protein YhaH (DUF805 family)
LSLIWVDLLANADRCLSPGQVIPIVDAEMTGRMHPQPPALDRVHRVFVFALVGFVLSLVPFVPASALPAVKRCHDAHGAG